MFSYFFAFLDFTNDDLKWFMCISMSVHNHWKQQHLISHYQPRPLFKNLTSIPNYIVEWEQSGWPRPVATVSCQYLSLDRLQFVCSAVHSWPAHHTLHGILFTPCFEKKKHEGGGLGLGLGILERKRQLSLSMLWQTHGMEMLMLCPASQRCDGLKKCVKSVMNFQCGSKNTFFNIAFRVITHFVVCPLFFLKENAFCRFWPSCGCCF